VSDTNHSNTMAKRSANSPRRSKRSRRSWYYLLFVSY
jgi:hypothetical protein